MIMAQWSLPDRRNRRLGRDGKKWGGEEETRY